MIFLSPAAYCGCDELLGALPAIPGGSAKGLDVWLPVDEFNVFKAHAKDPSTFSSHFLNPRTGETKRLPLGWLPVDYFAVPDDEPWVLVMKPLAKHEAIYNFVNLKTGAILLNPDDPGSSLLSSASKFSNGYSIVRKPGSSRYYLLNTTGRMIPVDPRVNWMIEGSRGLFPARVDNSFSAFVNPQGQIVLPVQPNPTLPSPQEILRVDGFKNELALFSIGQTHGYDPTARFGYMDRRFAWKIPPRFKEADGFVESRAWVKEDELWGIIDINGEWIVQPKFSFRSWGETSDYFIASEPGKPIKVYNLRGEEAYELPKEANSHSLNSIHVHDGLALLPRTDGGQRYFDLHKQEWIGDFNYEVTHGFRYGYARITIHGKAQNNIVSFAEGYLNLDGKIVALMPRLGDVKTLSLPSNVLLEAVK